MTRGNLYFGWFSTDLWEESNVQKNLEFFFIVKSVTADGSLRSPTGGVEGLNPAPHIHEQFTIQKWLQMATTLRIPSRITTSRLSTMR